MKKKNKRNIVYGLLFCGTLGIALFGIFAPGQLLRLQSRSGLGAVTAASDQYFSAAGSAAARNASANLSVDEKMQLILGMWESETSDAASYEMELQNFEAAASAREGLKKLYDIGLYPTDISEGYGNWYTWEARARKAVDTTFYTYTAYFWEIRFRKYNSEEEHTVYLLEDGTVLLANAYVRDGISEVQSDGIVSNLREDGVEIVLQDSEKEIIADWIPYPDIETENLQWKCLAQIERGEQAYSLILAASETQYLYAVMPQQGFGE